jgi:cellulose synthase/poly-beta-1,6-N-acetylglucosamine synthase-like glycosyltransferase
VQAVAPAERVAATIERVFAAEARVSLGRAPGDLRAHEPGRRLGALLIGAGALHPASLRHALAVQRRVGMHLGRILLAHGLVSHDRLAAALADQLRLPYVRDLHVHRIDPAAQMLPERVCRANRLVPVQVVDGTLVVAMTDPLDGDAAAAVREASPLPVRVVVSSDAEIESALKRIFAPHYVDVSTTALLRRRPEESAYRVLSPSQKVTGIALLLALALGFGLAPLATANALALLSILFYFAVSAYKFYLVERTLRFGTPEIVISPTELELLDERTLPPYTILVPLYHEAVVLRQLVEALDRLDYPRAKLDIKLLLEEDDAETIAAARATRLGAHYDVVIVPNAQPKTKPKACNYGLQHARGRYVVIYDAEDLPEPDQLKKAVVAFRRLDPRVVCIQAKLNYWNRDQNLLTRWFTSEYSQWFDVFLPGLDSTNAPIPLGGTSNHFAVETLLELGAWDPFNVTEDADLGIRLARAGYRTAMMDSTTYEEANPRVYNWIRQRSRWVKGYIQTWLVHMRHPVRLWHELGAGGFLSFQLVVGGTFLTMLMNPLFWALTSVWALSKADVIRELFPGFVYFAGAFNLLIGNFVFTYLNVVGTLRRGYDDLVRYAFFSPLYWALMSVGAWKGALQLVTRPSYWEKTVHGLAQRIGAQ